MSIGGDIVEEHYEKYVIPSYHKLLRECLDIIKGAHLGLNEFRRKDIIKKIEVKLGESKD